MSQEIICRDCQTRNTPGSKFCNKCGSRLPASTKIICPSCETPNPHNRFYCDNCGTRLVEEDIPKVEPKEKPSGTGKTFSLPIRPPGDTGELDPKQSIPDWLKGQTDSNLGEEEDDSSPRRNLPKIEDVGNAKRMTDDLPDWLIDEHESNPVLGSPRIITTEHYLNLIDDTEDSIKEESEGATEKTNLPDWLNNLATPVSGETATTSEDQSTADDALSEWLASISEPDNSDNTELSGEAASIPSSEDLEQKLDELSQSDSGFSGLFGDSTDDEDETADWLSEISPSATGSLAETDDEEPAEDLEDEMFDWLADSLSDTGMLTDPAAEMSLPESDDTVLEESPDWLAKGDFGTAGDDVLADLADAVALQDIGSSEDDLPDWITGQDADSEDATTSTKETQPDWMTEFTASATGPLESSEPDIDDIAIEETAVPPSEPLTTDSEETAVPPAPAFEASELIPTGELQSTGPLPDWLADFDEGDSLIATTASENTILNELLTPDDDPEMANLDWLDEEFADEEDEETAVVPDDSPALIGGDTDWLTELVSLGDDAFAVEADEPAPSELVTESQPTSEPDTAPDLFAADWPEETGDLADEEDGEETPEVHPESQESEWLQADSMLADALEEELPDWLEELGTPQSDSSPPVPDESLVTGDSLPDWIADMEPGSVQTGSHISDPANLSSLSGSLLDIPDDLASHELPDWLQDSTGDAGIEFPAEITMEDSADIPNWLQTESGLISEDGLESGTTSNEWTAIFQDLPPASTARDRLTSAELPDWIAALKPAELTGEQVPEAEKPVQEGGPLSGMRGVIDIEPVIAQPRDYAARSSFTITPNQQTQVTLLKQLSLAEQTATETVIVTPATSVWTRLVLAVLLVAAILAGLRLPDVLPQAQPAAKQSVTMAFDTVQDAAQKSVLVAVEYTPAMAGELDVQAEMLIEHLLANGSQIVTMSQFAAGTAVAQTLTPDQPTLGLVPGESVGLRQLGDCLPDCAVLNGNTLNNDVRQTLADVDLIIVLTGERDSLVNWLEQVGSRHDIPIMAGVTQSLAPVAAPYFDSGQLAGVIAGMPDTAVYQQLLLSEPGDTVMSYLSAQSLAQLLAAALLLVGGLGYIVAGLFNRGKSQA